MEEEMNATIEVTAKDAAQVFGQNINEVTELYGVNADDAVNADTLRLLSIQKAVQDTARMTEDFAEISKKIPEKYANRVKKSVSCVINTIVNNVSGYTADDIRIAEKLYASGKTDEAQIFCYDMGIPDAVCQFLEDKYTK